MALQITAQVLLLLLVLLQWPMLLWQRAWQWSSPHYQCYHVGLRPASFYRLPSCQKFGTRSLPRVAFGACSCSRNHFAPLHATTPPAFPAQTCICMGNILAKFHYNYIFGLYVESNWCASCRECCLPAAF